MVQGCGSVGSSYGLEQEYCTEKDGKAGEVGMIREYIIKVDEEKKDIMGDCPLEEKPKELVRCKDCKHKPTDNHIETNVGLLCFPCFPDDMCPYNIDDPFYSSFPEDDWFCHNGER